MSTAQEVADMMIKDGKAEFVPGDTFMRLTPAGIDAGKQALAASALSTVVSTLHDLIDFLEGVEEGYQRLDANAPFSVPLEDEIPEELREAPPRPDSTTDKPPQGYL